MCCSTEITTISVMYMDVNKIHHFATENLAVVFDQAKEMKGIKNAHHFTESTEAVHKIAMKPYTTTKSNENDNNKALCYIRSNVGKLRHAGQSHEHT